MSFLFPNLLWGLLATSIPLIIHLFSLRNNKSIEFSSIMHIRALKSKTIKKLKIRQWILIALRMGIISSLVFMSSGAILINESIWIPSEKESVAVIIIDNSASMSLINDGTSFLDEVKEEIPLIVSSFDGVGNLHVFQTSPPQEIYSGVVEEGVLLKPESWEINQSNGRDKLWTLVDSILVSIDSSLPNRECFILSDFQAAPPKTFMDDFKKWRFFAFSRDALNDNIAIMDISSINKIKMPNNLLKLNAKIENMGNNDRRNIPVELYLNGDRVGQIVSSFKTRASKDFLFQVYPGKSGVIRGRLEIPQDNFRLDDKQTFELNIPEQISAKVISNSESNLFIFKSILQSISGENQFLNIELKIMSEIDRVYLDETDILILHDPKFIKPRAIEALKRFLEEGGTLLWFAGENYKSINDQIMKNLSLPNYLNKIELINNGFLNVNILDRDNPLLEDLNIRNIDSSLPKIFIYNSIKLKNNHNTILEMSNEEPFLINIPYSGSQIYFFTSPLDLSWNDFTIKGLLIPLIHRLLILSAKNELNTDLIEVNKPKIIKLPKELINNKWSINFPSGKEILIIPNYNDEAIIFKETSELGSYEVSYDGNFYTAFSTKLSPYESPKLRSSFNEISSVIGSDNLVWISSEMPKEEIIGSTRYGQLLWRIFLIIAIVLFMVESFISRPNQTSLKLEK